MSHRTSDVRGWCVLWSVVVRAARSLTCGRKLGLFLATALLSAMIIDCPALADTFGDGGETFEIEFVSIGDPGNLADTNGWPEHAGAVAYPYRMAKYEISERMIKSANAVTADDEFPLNIDIANLGPDKPAISVSWIEAALFVNWLNESTGHAPAYKFEDIRGIDPPPPNAILRGFALWEPGDAGYDPNNLFRNRRAFYFLPNVDEWYKAAYYDPKTESYFPFPTYDFTDPVPVASGTDSNTAVFLQGLGEPADITEAGGATPYGTVAQGGNISEWLETELDLSNDDKFATRLFRGGDWGSSQSSLSSIAFGAGLPINDLGFRIASVPEPTCLGTFAITTLGVIQQLRRRRSDELVLKTYA